MTITKAFKWYFQKSKAFLFPLLEIKKGAFTTPKQTYVAWHGHVQAEDRKLICLYEKATGSKQFQEKVLRKHPWFLDAFERDEKLVYIFDYMEHRADWDAFLTGQYSRLSESLKQHVRTYYGATTPEWSYMESFLYPDKFFQLYANLLYSEDEREEGFLQLLRGGELCSRFDPEKETLRVSTP